MALRSILIRVLLGSLAATALCALVSIVASGATWGWRLTGTAAILAVASALLTPLGRIGDLKSVPPVAVAWALVIVTDTCAALLGTWDAIPSRWQDEVGITALLLLAWLVLALPGLALAGGRAQRVAGIVVAGGATAAFLWWDAIAWNVSLDDSERGWLLVAAGYTLGGAMLRYTEQAEPHLARVARLAAIGLTALAVVWWMAVLPTQVNLKPPEPHLLGIGVAISTAAILLAAHRCSTMLAGPGWRVALHLATLIAIGVLGCLMTWSAWQGFPYHPGLISAVAGIGILAGTGTLASLILHLFSRGATARRTPLAEVTHVRVDCPACGLRQPIAPGAGRCGRCGLGMEVRLTLLVCPACAYELAGLPAGAACPECGADPGVRALPRPSQDQ